MTSQTAIRPSLPALQWRRELLILAYAGMELSWFTLFFLALVRPAWRFPPYVVAGLLAGLMLIFYLWTRLAELRQMDVAQERLALLLALPGVILLGWRLFLHPGLALLDLSWLRLAGYSLVVGGSGNHWGVMLAAFYLWWRCISLGRREYSFEGVAYNFRQGLLLLIAGTLLLSLLAGRQVMAFIFPFFFFSLLAVSLARLEEVGQVRGEVGRLFDIYWLAVLLLSVLLILGAGRFLLLLASPEGIDMLRRWWSPVGNALANALIWLLSILLAPLEPLFQKLALLVASIWQEMAAGGALAPLDDVVLGGGEIDTPLAAPFIDLLIHIIRLLCGGGLILALLAAGLWMLKRERQRMREQAEAHEALDVSLGDALAGLLRNMRDRLRNAAGVVGQFGLGSDLLAAISVRNLYANSTRLARKRGFPRNKALTPYEYLADLQRAFPAAPGEAQAITDAYVNVHYGELPTGREEMQRLRDAYDRLKASPVSPHD